MSDWPFPKELHPPNIQEAIRKIEEARRTLAEACLKCKHARIGVKARSDHAELYCFDCGGARAQRFGFCTEESISAWTEDFLKNWPESKLIWQDTEGLPA